MNFPRKWQATKSQKRKTPLKAGKSGKSETWPLVPSIPDHYLSYESTFSSEKFCGKCHVSTFKQNDRWGNFYLNKATSKQEIEELLKSLWEFVTEKEESFVAQRDAMYCLTDLQVHKDMSSQKRPNQQRSLTCQPEAPGLKTDSCNQQPACSVWLLLPSTVSFRQNAAKMILDSPSSSLQLTTPALKAS